MTAHSSISFLGFKQLRLISHIVHLLPHVLYQLLDL